MANPAQVVGFQRPWQHGPRRPTAAQAGHSPKPTAAYSGPGWSTRALGVENRTWILTDGRAAWSGFGMGEQWRAQFDAEVSFANGGGLRTEGFRLDIPGQEITDDDLATLFVRHLGLLMVAEVRISAKTILEEPHRGGRGSRSIGRRPLTGWSS
ncbi:hypothetical protein NKG94_29565 [Micromonospora sp. M12]